MRLSQQFARETNLEKKHSVSGKKIWDINGFSFLLKANYDFLVGQGKIFKRWIKQQHVQLAASRNKNSCRVLQIIRTSSLRGNDSIYVSKVTKFSTLDLEGNL